MAESQPITLTMPALPLEGRYDQNWLKAQVKNEDLIVTFIPQDFGKGLLQNSQAIRCPKEVLRHFSGAFKSHFRRNGDSNHVTFWEDGTTNKVNFECILEFLLDTGVTVPKGELEGLRSCARRLKVDVLDKAIGRKIAGKPVDLRQIKMEAEDADVIPIENDSPRGGGNLEGTQGRIQDDGEVPGPSGRKRRREAGIVGGVDLEGRREIPVPPHRILPLEEQFGGDVGLSLEAIPPNPPMITSTGGDEDNGSRPRRSRPPPHFYNVMNGGKPRQVPPNGGNRKNGRELPPKKRMPAVDSMVGESVRINCPRTRAGPVQALARALELITGNDNREKAPEGKKSYCSLA